MQLHYLLADNGLIVPRLLSFATLTNVSVLKSLLFCGSQDSPTEFSLTYYSFTRSTSVRLSPYKIIMIIHR